MPFGLRNAPSSFQRIMNLVLGDLIDSCCVVYLDDILIYSKNKEEHEEHLRRVLERLNYYGLLCNMKKSKFFCSEVKYLGFKISNNSVHVDEDKIEVIKEWKIPNSVTEVRSFLGLANYYRRFIKGYTQLAVPLLELTKKEKGFQWSENCQKSFDSIKEALSSAPVLRMPNFALDFHIWPDASNVAAGGVLTQEFGSGHQPLAFLSKKFSDAESKYSTTERELLAILICLRRWRCYIDGRKVHIHSDHKPLTWAKGLKNPKPRVWSWLEEMEYYSPSIVFVPGEKQPGDALSRLQNDMASVQEDEAPSSAGDLSPVFDRLLGHVEEAGEQNSKCKTKIENNHLYFWPVSRDSEISKNRTAVLFRNPEYSLNNFFVMDGNTYPDTDWPVLCGNFLLDRPFPADLDGEKRQFIEDQSDHFEFKDGTLMRKVKTKGKIEFIPFIASSKRLSLISKYHGLLGHLAGKSIIEILRTRYWWPDMNDDVYSFVSNCRQCQLSRAERQPAAPLHPLEPVPLPFERLGIDFIQDLPYTETGYRNILVFVDYATRWVVALPTQDRSSHTVLKCFVEKVVNNYGLPDSIVSDRAQYFKEGVFAEYLKRNGVKQVLSSSYHPRTNGMTERINRILKDMLRKYCDGFPEKWDRFLDSAVFALRVRIHTVTGFSPFYLLYGKNARLPGDRIPEGLFDFSNWDERRKYTLRELDKLGKDRSVAYDKSKEQARMMRESQELKEDILEDAFELGTFVKKKNHVKQSLDYPWTGPFIVSEILPNSLYRLITPNGDVYPTLVHQDDLRRYSSKDLSKFYHGRRMLDLSGINESVEPVLESEEGGVVMLEDVLGGGLD
jgi:transposase InsO family protein